MVARGDSCISRCLLARAAATVATFGRIALPVTYVGKTATFALFWGFPVLLLGSLPGAWGATLSVIGWAFALWGTFRTGGRESATPTT